MPDADVPVEADMGQNCQDGQDNEMTEMPTNVEETYLFVHNDTDNHPYALDSIHPVAPVILSILMWV